MPHEELLVAIFGGSFNPPTEGHLSLIEAFRAQHPRCLLVIAPTTQNPWKREAPVSQQHRMQMIARTLECHAIKHQLIDVSREEHRGRMEILCDGGFVWDHDPGEIWVVNERYVLMADLVYRWRAEILQPFRLGDRLGIVVATDGASTVQNWVNWKAIEPLVELVEMPITVQVHATDVREGRRPFHPAILPYVNLHLRSAYPNAMRI